MREKGGREARKGRERSVKFHINSRAEREDGEEETTSPYP